MVASRCGAQAPGAWASVVVACGLSSCGTGAQVLHEKPALFLHSVFLSNLQYSLALGSYLRPIGMTSKHALGTLML